MVSSPPRTLKRRLGYKCCLLSQFRPLATVALCWEFSGRSQALEGGLSGPLGFSEGHVALSASKGRPR